MSSLYQTQITGIEGQSVIENLHSTTYLSHFNLLYHNSWVDERHEHISYAGDGRWDIESTLTLNLARLADLSSEISNGSFVPVPLLELEKCDRVVPVEIYDAHGRRLKVKSNEECYLYELLVLLGTIANANKHKLYEPTFDKPFKFPSSKLTNALWEEIRSFSPPPADRDFIAYFEEKLGNTEESLLDEWKKYRDHVPGFSVILRLFALHWVPVVSIDVGDSAYEVLSAKFAEFHQLAPRGNQSKPFRTKLFQMIKMESNLRYPLRRIGTAESESFIIDAPEWTSFSPCLPTHSDPHYRPCEITDESDVYRENPNAEQLIDADGMLTAQALHIRLCNVWDGATKNPKRRFAIPNTHCECPGANWGQHVSTNVHTYAIEIGWRAQSKKRGRAYAAFILVSLAALLYMNISICSQPMGLYSLRSTTNFLTSLCVLVPLLALVFSNLQEGTSYFRDYLLPGPSCWVKIGIGCDVVAFLFSLFLGFFPIEPIVYTINSVVLGVALAVMLLLTVLMLSWLRYNDDGFGVLNKSRDALLGVMTKIPIRRSPK